MLPNQIWQRFRCDGVLTCSHRVARYYWGDYAGQGKDWPPWSYVYFLMAALGIQAAVPISANEK